MTSSPEVVTFGEFKADLRARELRQRGLRLRLPDQSFRVLAILLERVGEIITRDELRMRLWPDQTFVDFDHGLNNAVNRLRDALGDSASAPTYIETLPRRGYRFIAPVTRGGERASQPGPTSPRVGPPLDREPDWPQAGEPRRTRSFRRVLVICAVASTCVLAGVLFREAVVAKYSIRRPVRSIAVLPFDNLSGDPAQDYFAAGVTDSLITELARIESLRIISRTSTMHYKGSRQSLPEIARELQVDAIVEGSVVRSGDRVRITAQLLEGASDRHLWAKAYDRDVREILSVQHDVALSIVNEIQAKLTPGEAVHLSVTARPVNPEAYSAYLEGRYYLARRSLNGYTKALTRLQHAIAVSPDYAPAHAELAECYNLLGLGMGPLSAMEAANRAREAARKALELDPDLAEAHAALAFTLERYDWNWAESEREYRRAIELEPDNPIYRTWFSHVARIQGRSQEAQVHIARARQVDPLSVQGVRSVADAYIASKQYEQANAYYRKAIELQPDSFRLRMDMGTGYSSAGQYQKAVDEFKTVIALYGQNVFPEAELGYAYARLSDRIAAEKIVEHLEKVGKPGYSSYAIARIYAALGNNEQALQWLQKACRERAAQMSSVNDDEAFALLHSDSRFQDIVRQIGLPLTDLRG